MIQAVLLLATVAPKPANFSLPKLLGASQSAVEHVLGKAFKPRRDPGYFFTPAGYEVIRINGFGTDMSAVELRYLDLLSPSNTLLQLGVDPKRAMTKSLPSPTNVQVHLVRNRFQILIKGLAVNPKTKKPWIISYEQDAHGNSERASGLKDQIQAATGQKRLDLIQSCYDWRTKIVVDSR